MNTPTTTAGRVAVVTGGAGAIGTAISRELQAQGYTVLGVDRDELGLRAIPGLVPLAADLTDPAFTHAVLAALDDLGGRCDLLVNNAGVVITTPFTAVTAEESRREQSVNLQAPMELSRALYPLLTRHQGQIISIVSLGAMMPLAESAGYSASKAGLRAFMQGLAMMTRETGVRISMVHPGAVDTPMLRHEATSGGSALNFLSTPLSTEQVAAAVMSVHRRPRLEVCVPRYDGWMLKWVGLAPGLLPRLRPLLERLAQPGLRRYRTAHGLTVAATEH